MSSALDKLAETASFVVETKRSKANRENQELEAIRNRVQILEKEKGNIREKADVLRDQAHKYEQIADYLEEQINRRKQERTHDTDAAKERLRVWLEEIGLPAEFVGLLFKKGEEAVEDAVKTFRLEAKKRRKKADELIKETEDIGRSISEMQSIAENALKNGGKVDFQTLKQKALIAELARDNAELALRNMLEEQEQKSSL